jgi:hypothetical protein
LLKISTGNNFVMPSSGEEVGKLGNIYIITNMPSGTNEWQI